MTPLPPDRRAVFLLALLLLVAAGAQSVWAGTLWAAGGQPDIIFTTVIVAALLSDPGTGVVLGAAGGLLGAALVGETVGTLIASRAVAGFAAGWLSRHLLQARLRVVVLGVWGATLLAEGIYLLAAPTVGLRGWLPALLIGATWNAVLSVPTMFLLRAMGWGRSQS